VAVSNGTTAEDGSSAQLSLANSGIRRSMPNSLSVLTTDGLVQLVELEAKLTGISTLLEDVDAGNPGVMEASVMTIEQALAVVPSQ